MDQSILNQKNILADILVRGNRLMANANTRRKRFGVGLSDKKESAMTNNLKISLKTFKRDEIPPK
jgi:hypothetical protein